MDQEQIEINRMMSESLKGTLAVSTGLQGQIEALWRLVGHQHDIIRALAGLPDESQPDAENMRESLAKAEAEVNELKRMFEKNAPVE